MKQNKNYFIAIGITSIKNTIIHPTTMKTILLYILSLLICSSCISYYQIHEMGYDNTLALQDKNKLIFEDENIVIHYNLWREKGEPGFTITNKTDTLLYIDLSECFYVRNGIANDYYKNRMFASSVSEAKSFTLSNSIDLGRSAFSTCLNAIANPTNLSNWAKVGGSFSGSKSSTNTRNVQEIEKMIITIPPNTTKVFKEYSICDSVLQKEELLKKPKKKQCSTISFSEDESPFKIENIITYRVKGKNRVVNNQFFLSTITNMREKDAIAKDTSSTFYLRNQKPMNYKAAKPNCYFIRYK